jgi:uncharacterized OB-fold protein
MSKKIRELPGITLGERDIIERRVLSTDWVPKLKWAWDTGMGYGRYLAELKKGSIVGTKCHKCHRILLPARVFCECCFRPVDEWVYLKDTGTVNTFSIAYTDWLARPIKEPRIPAMIEIDGSGGVSILHVLANVDPWKVKIGMKVKAVWKAEKDRQGAITDIRYWKPLKEG